MSLEAQVLRLEGKIEKLEGDVQELIAVVKEQNRILEGDKLNAGVYKRLTDLEAFVKWFKDKKSVALGYSLGVGGILTVGYIIAKVILYFKDVLFK